MKSFGLILIGSGLLAGSALAQTQHPADTDGDGTVTRAEFDAYTRQMTERRFAALDADGDGVLTQEEFRAARMERMERRRQGGPGFAGAGRRGMLGERIDANGDGAWSLAELQAVRPDFDTERFTALDTNGNGLIDADEQPMRRMRRDR